MGEGRRGGGVTRLIRDCHFPVQIVLFSRGSRVEHHSSNELHSFS